MRATPSTPEELFEGDPLGLEVLARVQAALEASTAEVRTTRSQVALRRRRAFAWVWPPGRYVRTTVPAVVSFALPRPLDSTRIKQVVEPRPGTWMHHVEVSGPEDVDDELVGWLQAAAEAAD